METRSGFNEKHDQVVRRLHNLKVQLILCIIMGLAALVISYLVEKGYVILAW